MSHYNPDPNKTVNLTIDGMPVSVPEGTRILEAAGKLGIKIPTLCDHPDLCKRSFCRLCVVECDGRGKLMAACANNVWEGVKVVTNNLRLLSIRKTIMELILANHPQDCLICVKNQKCELQELARNFGIRQSPFRRVASAGNPPKAESETLVRDMNKCVRCGRCVEACQEVQTIRAINSSYRGMQFEICTPYGQALSEGPCIFCGQCAAVCPVAAIYEHDQTSELWVALNSGERHVVAELASSVAEGVCREFDLPPGSVSSGKMVSALKRMGFHKVFDANVSVEQTINEESRELLDRIKSQDKLRGKLPLILSCSPGWFNFVKNFYPELLDHLPAAKDPIRNFGVLAKTLYAKESGIDRSKITSVSITPCIVKKHEIGRPEMRINGHRDVDAVLTTREIARMIKLAGIDVANINETPFDCVKSDCVKTGSPDNSTDTALEAIVRKVYTGDVPAVPPEIKETVLDVQGTKIKILEVNGLANARTVMETVKKGECDAAFVEIKSCFYCDTKKTLPCEAAQ